MNRKLKNRDGKRAIVIVAHPDDETIFCGGTMLHYSHWIWTVICMTYHKNSLRFQQFQSAMEKYRSMGVQVTDYLTLGQKDEKLLKEEELKWQMAIETLNITGDIVLTHNAKGEYGHPHHQLTNTIVKKKYYNVWEFICPGARNTDPQPYRSKICKVNLDADILMKKRQIFENCYETERFLWKALPDVMEYEFNRGPEIFTSEG